MEERPVAVEMGKPLTAEHLAKRAQEIENHLRTHGTILHWDALRDVPDTLRAMAEAMQFVTSPGITECDYPAEARGAVGRLQNLTVALMLRVGAAKIQDGDGHVSLGMTLQQEEGGPGRVCGLWRAADFLEDMTRVFTFQAGRARRKTRPMSEEKLEKAREWVTVLEGSDAGQSKSAEVIRDLLVEVEQLRAENEDLRPDRF